MSPSHPNPNRIAIVKLSSLGDIIHALPVACSLRATYPEAKLAWVVERKWLPLVEHHPSLDAVFTIDSFGLRRQPWRQSAAFRSDLRRLRQFAPDCALDLQGTLKSAVVSWRSGAPLRLGFGEGYIRERLAGVFYTRRVVPSSAHIVDQMLDVAAGLGPLRRDLRFPFPIPEAVRAEVAAWIETNRIGEFAFFSPGGGWASKRWPSARYAALAERLERQFGLSVVINRGPGERDMDEAHRRANEFRARLFAGDVQHLAAVLERARVAVGGDTGPMQLAVALGTPTVALFGPTDPARNGPYSQPSEVVRKTTAAGYRRQNTFSPSMLAISPEEVAAACGRVMAGVRA